VEFATSLRDVIRWIRIHGKPAGRDFVNRMYDKQFAKIAKNGNQTLRITTSKTFKIWTPRENGRITREQAQAQDKIQVL